jgi:hypothetical protein
MFQNIVRSVFRVLAWLFVVALIIQVYLAGLGVFQFRNFTFGEEGARSFFGLHIEFGWLLGLVSIFMLLLALLARYPRPVIGRTLGLFALMVVQSLILWIDQDAALIRALHPVNAIVLGWMAVSLATRASRTEEEQDEEAQLSAEEQPA